MSESKLGMMLVSASDYLAREESLKVFDSRPEKFHIVERLFDSRIVYLDDHFRLHVVDSVSIHDCKVYGEFLVIKSLID